MVLVSTEKTIPEIPRFEPPKEMISVSQQNGKTKVRVNSSSVDVIQNCLRKAKYSLHERWITQNEHPATLLGSSFHSALEVFYVGKREERKLPKLETMELMSYGHKVPNEETDLCLRATRAFIKKAKPLEALPETDKRSIQNGVWLLHNYFNSYLADPYVAFVDEAGPFIERKFSFVLRETADLIIEVFGTIDFGFVDVNSGRIIPGDHKTTSFLGFGDSSYFDREKPNHQYTLYAMGAHKVFGFEGDDFLVNIIEIKAKPKTAKAKGPSFPRQITTRTKEDFDEVTEVITHVVDLYLQSIKTGVWPQGPVGACTAYGSCMYRQVCCSPKSLRENVLSAKFVRLG